MKLIKSYLTSFIEIIFFIQIFIIPIHSQSDNSKNKENEYGMGFMKNIFLNIDVNDAFAAIKVWVTELNKHQNLNVSMFPVLYNDMNEAAKNFRKDNVCTIICNSIDYLKNKSRLPITPVLVDPGENGRDLQFIILVRKKDNIKTLAGLKKKKILIQKETNIDLINMWIAVQLYDNKLGKKEEFFQDIKEGGLASHTILSVFFGENDACIVTTNAYKTMVELNPQIGIKLGILLTSPSFVEGLGCYSNDFMKKKIKDNLTESVIAFDKYPSGKQIYNLLRVKKLLPFKEEYLKSAKELLKKYKAIESS